MSEKERGRRRRYVRTFMGMPVMMVDLRLKCSLVSEMHFSRRIRPGKE